MSYISDSIELIKKEMAIVANDYPDLKVIVADERQFVREKDRGSKVIYIAIRMTQATYNYGVAIQPITITAVSEANSLGDCQTLLLDFVSRYNLKGDGTFQQSYSAPAVITAFADVQDGYRALMYISGTLIAGDTTNPFTVTYTKDGKTYEVPIISSNLGCDTQLDTQATYGSANFTQSRAMVTTFTVGMTCYLTSEGLPLEALKVASKGNANDTVFPLTLSFRSGITIEMEARLSSFSINQSIGEMPVIAMTFTY